MEKQSCSFWIAVVVSAVLLCALALVSAALLIRNLYRLLEFGSQFRAIFAQIQDARLGYPVWLLLPQGLLCLLIVRLWRRNKRLAGSCVLLGGSVLMLLCALYFTRVNGILFGDVMVSLVQVLMKGGLSL